MNTTSQKIFHLVKQYDLIGQGDKILIALSGGPDSVFALYFFYKYSNKYKISLGAAHLNHSLRGTAADEDMAFCENMCSDLNVEYFQTKIDVSKYAVENKISFEEAGRVLRYDFLLKIADENSYNKIITAHTINDNTETVLLNLIKGTGVNGLAGIPVRRGKVIRPLLNITKQEILQYLDKNKTNYRVDESNYDIKYQRNFLRKEIIPLIKELNPSLEESIFSSSEIFKNLKLFIEEYTPEDIKNSITINNGKIEFSLQNLPESSMAVFSEYLRNILSKEYSSEFGFIDFNRIRELENSQSGKRISLPGKLIAIKEREKIKIFRDSEKIAVNINIRTGEQKKIIGKTLEIRLIDKDKAVFDNNRLNEFVSGDNLTDEFILRNWEPGDTFFPLGMNSPKTISDYLTDIKIPADEKKDRLVLVNGTNIIWVIGLRIDERYKVVNSTKRILQLCIS